MHGDALAEARIDLRGNIVLRHSKIKFLRHSAGHGDHGHLALPGLAEPALLGELLHETRAVAGGIGPVQRQPAIARQARDRHHQDNYEYFYHRSVPSAGVGNPVMNGCRAIMPCARHSGIGARRRDSRRRSGNSNLSDTPVISTSVIRHSARAVLVLALLLQGCTSTRTQWQLRQAVAVLEQRNDPDSLAAAAVLLRFTQRTPDEPAAHALIVRAVTLASGRADLAWLEIQNCRLVPGCDPNPEEARLRGLDPANGVAWINAMTRAN